MEFSNATAAFTLVALGALGFVCSLAETALFALARWQVRSLSSRGARGALVARLLERPDDVLSALSLVNTVANGMVMVTALVVAHDQGWSMWPTFAVAFLAVLIIGEMLPKTLAVRAPDRWSLAAAPAVALLLALTRPIRRLAQGGASRGLGLLLRNSAPPPAVTDEEYRELLEMAVQQGALGRSEKEIIAELITLDRKHARDVMHPRARVDAVSDELTTEELIAAARRLRHRFLPVYDETPDTIVGVLNTQQFLLDPHHRLEEAIEFPSFVPESMNLLQLFQALQRQKRSLAIVLDEFGAVAGIVRMEDILAEVLGRMTPQADSRGFVFERTGAGRWRVSGSMRLDDFRREHPALPEVPSVETMGGLLMSLLDVVPVQGETATFHGLRLTAQAVDERRVHEVLVERVGAR